MLNTPDTVERRGFLLSLAWKGKVNHTGIVEIFGRAGRWRGLSGWVTNLQAQMPLDSAFTFQGDLKADGQPHPPRHEADRQ